MKNINTYIIEKETTGAGSIQMIQTIFDELKNKYSDCTYDSKKCEYVGKHADLWKGAGQFLYDYLNELNKNELANIVKFFKWEDNIQNINNVQPSEISMCVASYFLKK